MNLFSLFFNVPSLTVFLCLSEVMASVYVLLYCFYINFVDGKCAHNMPPILEKAIITLKWIVWYQI